MKNLRDPKIYLGLRYATNRAIASWSAVALHRFGNNRMPYKSAKGLAHSKTWRLFL